MIGWLQGTVLAKQANQVILNVAGVGYEVSVPLSVLEKLTQGRSAELFIHHAVREDGHYLYGFHDLAQRKLFRELIRISGIGPKLGLLVLSSFTVEGLITIVRDGDTAALLKLSGVGKKTAERLMIELKDRVVTHASSFGVSMLENGEASPVIQGAGQEAVEALIALELKPAEAMKWVGLAIKSLSGDSDTAVLIKTALSLKLQGGRK